MGYSVPWIVPTVQCGNVCIGIEIEFLRPELLGRESLERMLWEINIPPGMPCPNALWNSIFTYFPSQGSPAV